MAVPSTSVLTALNPLIRTCQVTAFFVFSINTKTWKAEIKRFNIFIGLFLIASIVLLHCIYWSSYFGFDAHGTQVGKVFMPKLVYMNMTILTITKLWMFWNRQKIVNLFKVIQEVDDKFKELNVLFDYKSERRMQILVIFGIIGSVLVCTVLTLLVQIGYMIDIDPSLSILNGYQFTCSFFLNFQVNTALIGIRRRFSAINNLLRQQKEPETAELKIITKVHLKLVEVTETFNYVYGTSTMLFVSTCFGWCCLFVFLMVMMPVIMWTEYIFVTLVHILINVIMIMILYSLFYFAEWMKSEVNILAKVLHENFNRTDMTLVKQQLRHLTVQVSNFKVEFSCGMVDFNWKFLFKVNFYKLIFLRI